MWDLVSNFLEDRRETTNIFKSFRSLGGKLDASGNFRWFPGSTVIAFIPPGSSWHKTLCKVQDTVKESKIAQHFAFLPPDSFHCTIFSLVTEQSTIRPSDVPPDIAPDLLEGEMITRMKPLMIAEKRQPSHFEFVFDHVLLKPMGTVIQVVLKPANDDSKRRLAEWRKKAAEATKLPLSGGYSFHITIAYQKEAIPDDHLKEMQRVEKSLNKKLTKISKTEPLVLGPPRLCFFRDMLKFDETPIYSRNLKLMKELDN